MADGIKKITLQNGKVRYRAIVDAGRDANGKRIQLTITRDTKAEAREERARIQAARAGGTFVPPNKITVAGWLDEWLKLKERDIEATSIEGYRAALVHVYEHLGHIRLQELTEDHVQDFLDRIVTGGRRKGGAPGTRLAVSTVEGILARLREALGRAVVRKLVVTNVAQFVKVSLQDRKTDRQERRRAKPWTVDEVQTFIRGIEGDRLYAPLLLSLMGLRPAEVCGMRWSDIDLELGTLETANTRTMINNKTVLEKNTKTVAGERTLPLPKWVWEALKRFRAQQAREKLSHGAAYTDSGYVVVDELGVVLNTRQLREMHAYRLMAAVGLRKVRLYDARHSCLTYLAVSGVPDVVLAAWAGHTNASFTRAKYVHPGVDDLRPAADAWDAFHGGDTARS